MLWIDRLERMGRLVLWLALSSACVLAPISYIRARAAEAEEERADAKAKADAEAKKEAETLAEKVGRRIAITSVGEYLSGLDVSRAKGDVWFTNATPRSGVVCITGEAENPSSKMSTSSIASCVSVAPYASAVEVPLLFAGRELQGVCPTSSACSLKVQDVPEPPAVASATTR